MYAWKNAFSSNPYSVINWTKNGGKKIRIIWLLCNYLERRKTLQSQTLAGVFVASKERKLKGGRAAKCLGEPFKLNEGSEDVHCRKGLC